MRRILVALALLAALTACGEDRSAPDREARDPSSSTSARSTSDAPTPPEVVTVVSAPAPQRVVSTDEPTVLDDAGALADYVAGLGSGALADEVTRAVEAHRAPPGRVVAAAVVAVGCDVPRDATVAEQDGRWVVTPVKPGGAPKQCYVPFASVAVVELPA